MIHRLQDVRGFGGAGTDEDRKVPDPFFHSEPELDLRAEEPALVAGENVQGR